jgi:hypothetical protein
MAKMKINNGSIQIVARRQSNNHSYITSGHVKWYSHSGKQCGSSLKILNIQLPYNPVITVLLGSYPRKMKTYVYTKTYTKMLIAALFMIKI